jgi:alpha-glucosidase
MADCSKPLPGVSVFSYGSPFETGAFLQSPSSMIRERGELPSGIEVSFSDQGGFALQLRLSDGEGVVGLGQRMGPVNCRGNAYRLFSTDCPVHIPSIRSMYGTHPFMIILRDSPLGVFVDAPGEIIVDVGCSKRHEVQVRVPGRGCNLVVIEGESLKQIVSRYMSLTGSAYIPPRWAFGYHQSRWSYPDESTVRDIAGKLREHDIPCDVIHADIHYMDNYKVFTVDSKRFPNMSKLSEDLAEQGIKLISILDPGVKREAGYSVYEEGEKNRFFCQRQDGTGTFYGAVWPGPSAFPDFFQERVRAWWGAQYKQLLDQGIAGFWNDMNEPSIFYTPEAFDDFARKIERLHKAGTYQEEVANTLFDKDVVGKESYYEQFTHSINGETVNHKEVHNLYGTMMTKSTAEFLASHRPNKRSFLLSRSSYPGMHRYAAIWTGDNHSWWEHLSLNIQHMISLNLMGFLFCGADTGGFGGDCSPDLLVRWTQLSAFAPFFRNHAAMWATPQEPWAFDQETLARCREAIKLRYSLMPYLYSEFVRAACNGEPFIRGLFYDYRSAWKRLSDDQFMCGANLLVAPVIEPGADHRRVWLPEGDWLSVRGTETGLVGVGVTRGGDTLAYAPLSVVPLYMPSGSLVPMTKPGNNPPADRYRLVGFTDSSATCSILLDDGEQAYANWGSFPKAVCSVSRQDGRWSTSVRFEGCLPRTLTLELELWDSSGRCHQETVAVA